MTRMSRTLAVLALAAAALVPAGGAHAQYYGAAPQPAPLYPYAAPSNQPYAVEVAPGTYEIRRPKAARQYRQEHDSARRTDAPQRKRPVTRNDPAVLEELRQRHNKRGSIKHEVIHTKKIVHEKPIVIETTRVVDDPPKVIKRYHYVDGPMPGPRRKQVAERHRAPQPAEAPKRDDGKKRVIEADAEVTILGPDRMSIRLFRKGQGRSAKASAE